MARKNDKREAFIREYIKDSNGTQAAIRAGYSRRTANEQAAELLAIPSIREAVDKLKAKATEKAIVDAAYVLKGLKELYELCANSKSDKFDPSSANRSLELLGKHLKLFTEKVEHSGDVSHNFTVIVKRRDE
jgi:phage terminase small subunit